MLFYILWILENIKKTFAFVYIMSLSFILIIKKYFMTNLNLSNKFLVIEALLLSFIIIFSSILYLTFYAIYTSHNQNNHKEKRDWKEFIEPSKEIEKYNGKKIPMFIFVKYYLDGKIKIKKSMMEIMENRYQLFEFTIRFEHISWFLKQFFRSMLGHGKEQDYGEITSVYNLGNDFYSYFLGSPMIYTGGIFNNEEETIEDGQNRKMKIVCENTHMKEAKTHLDIGCGWGTLARYSQKNYGVESTGIAIASEQIKWCNDKCKEENVNTTFKCLDYRDIGTKQKYDVITCLEMAEHVGIRNFSSFCEQVYDLLEEDGRFYLQIAGLRRPWKFEDAIWGLFMDRYIFPGADASCPLAFNIRQLEDAGFEIHRVENTGTHYAITMVKWYENWVSNKDKVIEKYGDWWWRLFEVFLSWSVMIARQGSSTVWMITCNKNLGTDVRTDKLSGKINRTKLWVGDNKIATQQ